MRGTRLYFVFFVLALGVSARADTSSSLGQDHDSASSSQTASGQSNTPLVVRDAPAASDVPVAPVEHAVDSTAREGQVRLNYTFPTYECPNDPEESRRLQACVARDPSPLSNIVLDVGHSDHTNTYRDHVNKSADRSSRQRNLHEGHINFATALMTKNMLERCYGLPPDDIELSRYPGEVEFGEFHNSRRAQDAVDYFRYDGEKRIASELDNDAAARRNYIRHLLGRTEAERKKSIMVSVHANAAGGDYATVIYSPNAPNDKSKNVAHDVTRALVKHLKPNYDEALAFLRSQDAALAEQGVSETDSRRKALASRIQTVTKASRFDYAGGSRPIVSSDYGIVRHSAYDTEGALVLAEGFFMDGTLGEVADAQIAKNTDDVKKLYEVYRMSAPGTSRELALRNLNNRIRENTVSVNTEIYNAAEGRWIAQKGKSYNVAPIFVNYAKGLSAGVATQALKQCDAT